MERAPDASAGLIAVHRIGVAARGAGGGLYVVPCTKTGNMMRAVSTSASASSSSAISMQHADILLAQLTGSDTFCWVAFSSGHLVWHTCHWMGLGPRRLERKSSAF